MTDAEAITARKRLTGQHLRTPLALVAVLRRFEYLERQGVAINGEHALQYELVRSWEQSRYGAEIDGQSVK